MHSFLMVLLFLFMGQDAPFYNKVLGDYRRNSYFVAVGVQSDEYTGLTIIENDNLYYLFNRIKGYDKEKYKAFMKEQLLNKINLDLHGVNLKKSGFFKVATITSVEEQASKGLEKFIGQYFRGKVIRGGIGAAERNAVISKLFEFGVAAYIDDETGYLAISR